MIVLETFRRVNSYNQKQLVQESPDCFNGEVSIRKYRITVEEIDEPKAVLIKRLKKLWSECDNHHNWDHLRAVAKELGIELDFADLPKRT